MIKLCEISFKLNKYKLTGFTFAIQPTKNSQSGLYKSTKHTKKMKKYCSNLRKLCLFMVIASTMCIQAAAKRTYKGHFDIKGQNIIAPNGEIFHIKGTNLGNWLNPEGYMFIFDKVSSYRMIDQAFKELVGPDRTNYFWHQFQDKYITREDIHYIKMTGMNSIRIPFHYKLFTNQDYMGYNNAERGFELLDRVIKWCKAEGLYVILDMHDAPGGQTGDNIDDSYAYPWLFESTNDQTLFCSIWQKIAKRYANETTILGYDLLNEPIAHYFANKDDLNKKLESVYKMGIAAIRQYDKNHIVMLGGAQWNSNFTVFNDYTFDKKMMYTCHRYWTDTLQSNIQDFLDFRNKVNLPMYMGETGENTDEWVGAFRKLLERNNIGWHFWPYKKMESKRGIVNIVAPAKWNLIVEYTKQDRSGFDKIRATRPSQNDAWEAMNALISNLEHHKCITNDKYIKALGLQP